MNLHAYARLLHRKISSANRKAKNPFTDETIIRNPFERPLYTTVVWVEPDDNVPNEFKKPNNTQ